MPDGRTPPGGPDPTRTADDHPAAPAPTTADGNRATDEQPPSAAERTGGQRRAVEEGLALLPDVTSDERDVGWGDPYERDDDERFLREVPPHHGG